MLKVENMKKKTRKINKVRENNVMTQYLAQDMSELNCVKERYGLDSPVFHSRINLFGILGN